MNTELLNTIEGRAGLIEMHASAIARMVPDRSFPAWPTKAERELADAETRLRNALRLVEQMRQRIAASEREAA